MSAYQTPFHDLSFESKYKRELSLFRRAMNQKSYLDSSINTRGASHRLELARQTRRSPSPYYEKLIVTQDKSRRYRFCNMGQGYCVKGDHAHAHQHKPTVPRIKQSARASGKLPAINRPSSSSTKQTDSKPSQSSNDAKEKSRLLSEAKKRAPTAEPLLVSVERDKPSAAIREHSTSLEERHLTSSLVIRPVSPTFGLEQSSPSKTSLREQLSRDCPDSSSMNPKVPLPLKHPSIARPFFSDLVPPTANPLRELPKLEIELLPSMIVASERETDPPLVQTHPPEINYNSDEDSDDPEPVAKNGLLATSPYEYSDGTMRNSLTRLRPAQ